MKLTPVMTTASGVVINYLEPESCEIREQDICFAAENICRYNGARNVRLLDHFALVTLLAMARKQAERDSVVWTDRLVGLVALHDFHETVVGDVVSGLKMLLPEFKRIEDLWEKRFHAHFGYDLPHVYEKHHVIDVDLRALVVETHATSHPVQKLTAERHGGPPTELEMACWYSVLSASSAEKWLLTLGAVHKGSARKGNTI